MTKFHFDSVRASKAQINLIEKLSTDLEFFMKARDAHIESICGRKAKPDELSMAEASLVIDKFIEWKESK